jgi:hypothetical protein
MDNNIKSFTAILLHPIKFRLFLLSKLPSAYFAGVRIRKASEESCSVSIPYKWFSKNPFRSTYFACLAMAAEMSTGALGMMHLHNRIPRVSMLVVKVEGEYFKKATGRTLFTCNEGLRIRQTIQDAIDAKESRSIAARSDGRNEAGEIVATFYITWSFKAKT